MVVKELIEKLREMDQDAEVMVPYDEYDNTDADFVYADTREVGIATPHPRTINIVVIEYTCRGS